MVKPPQILLQNGTLGDTVDETEGLIKRHEAFEKLLSSQEDKVFHCTAMVVFNVGSTLVSSCFCNKFLSDGGLWITLCQFTGP